MSTPRSARSDLDGLVEHDLHRAGVPLADCERQLARRARWASTSASATTAPSALETALCAIASTFAVAQARPPRRARRRSSAARSSPACTSGRPLTARAERVATARGPSAGARDGGQVRRSALAEHRARAGGPRARRRRGAGAARRGPRRCRCRAAATEAARARQATPAASASARWRSQLSGPEARGDRVRGREQQAVGAGAVAVGDDHHLPARRRRLREQRLELARIECRAVARDAQHALDALRQRALRPRARTAADWPPSAASSTTSAPGGARRRRRRPRG